MIDLQDLLEIQYCPWLVVGDSDVREQVLLTENGERWRHQGALSKVGGVVYFVVMAKGVFNHEIDDVSQELEGKLRCHLGDGDR